MNQDDSSATPLPFKVFGLQRTGTNLVRVLMTRNFRVKYLEESATGWKHGPPSRVCYADGGLPTRFILCVKNPYAWLVSCYRYFRNSYKFDATMPQDFLADPAMTFEEFVRNRSYEFANPVQRWNFACRCWLSTLPPMHTMVVRQEDLLGSVRQSDMLKEFASKLQLEQVEEARTGTDSQIDVDTTVRGRANHTQYLLREYMTEYLSSLLDLVNDALDWDLMGRFGYVREDWALVRRQANDLGLWVRQGTSDGREVWHCIGDPYGLRSIRDKSSELRGIIDIGAHIGQTTLFARHLWPKCPIDCYEPCMENFRMLRLNTRDVPDVHAVPSAVSDGPSGQIGFRGDEDLSETGGGFVSDEGDRLVGAIGLEEVVSRLEKVDLLKIGCPQAAIKILTSSENHALIGNIPWIVGRLPESKVDHQPLLEVLNKTHCVSGRRLGKREYFLAERMGQPQ